MGIEAFLLDEAEKEGHEKGRNIGREESIRNIALKMKNHGLDMDLIANVTDISVEEIKKLS